MTRYTRLPPAAYAFRLLTLLVFGAYSSLSLGGTAVTGGADDVDIRYAVSGDGDTSLVFVHGWSCDSGYWSEQIRAFDDRYRVITLDLAGHGQSGSERQDWSMTAFGRDVAAVVNAAAPGPVVLIGHSMGGQVVLEAAQALGDKVALIVGVDTLQTPGVPALTAEESRRLWAPFSDDYAAATAGFVRQSFFLPDSPTELVDRVASDMAGANPEVALAAGHELTMYSNPDGLRAASATPLVLINAAYRPTDTDTLRALHPQSSLRLMQGVGHFPMLEDPAAFNRILAEVLDAGLGR
ncbi:MAG: alpha/beta hydrolase [Pseudomonadota bacterium]